MSGWKPAAYETLQRAMVLRSKSVGNFDGDKGATRPCGALGKWIVPWRYSKVPWRYVLKHCCYIRNYLKDYLDSAKVSRQGACVPWLGAPLNPPHHPPWSLVPSDPFQRPSSAAVNQQSTANRANCGGRGFGSAMESKIAMHIATISPPQVGNPSLLAETQSDCQSDCPPGAASHPLMQKLIHS